MNFEINLMRTWRQVERLCWGEVSHRGDRISMPFSLDIVRHHSSLVLSGRPQCPLTGSASDAAAIVTATDHAQPVEQNEVEEYVRGRLTGFDLLFVGQSRCLSNLRQDLI
jgi:hypothetical protein